jgi:hypothetical protein
MAATTPVQPNILPAPGAPPAPVPTPGNVQGAALPAIREASIQLLPEDRQRLDELRMGGMTCLMVGKVVAKITICMVKTKVGLIAGISIVVLCMVAGIALFILACKGSPYESPTALNRMREEARAMNLGQLIDAHGLERVSHYNLLTPQERIAKYTEWKQTPSIRSTLPKTLYPKKLYECGFMTAQEQQVIRDYFALDNDNRSRLRDRYLSDIGWIENSPAAAPRE